MSMSPVRQPLHILRKDALHIWPETLCSFALLIAFAWAESSTLAPKGQIDPSGLAAGLLRFLIPVSWLVLTSRLVHDEELVGDRQFWITRPYTWYSLLLSKALYLALFIGVPFIAVQAWLMHHANLYPTKVIPSLLGNFLWMALILLLPFFAVAAVTATFVRYATSMLGGIIYVFVVIVYAGYKWSDKLDVPHANYILGGVFAIGLIAATVLQYLTRKTMISRIILVSLPVVFLVIAFALPLNSLIAHQYPETSVGNVTFATDFPAPPPEGRLAVVRGEVQLILPVHVDLPNIADNAYVEDQRFQVTLDGPDGYHYASNWIEAHQTFAPHQIGSFLPLTLPADVFDKIHTQSVALHIKLGVQTFTPGASYTVTATEKPFPVPGHGACTLSAENGSLECKYPFANPTLAVVTGTVHSGDCLNPGPQSATGAAHLPPGPISIGFNPVETQTAQFQVGQQKVPLCANTPVTFTTPVEGPKGRLALDIPAITLEAYAQHYAVKDPKATKNPQPEPQPEPSQQ